MQLHAGDTFSFTLLTGGTPTDADSTPIGTCIHNGADDGTVTINVTHKATGRYVLSGTVPSGYAASDTVEILGTATVGGSVGQTVVGQFNVSPTTVNLNLAQTVPTTNTAHTVGDALNAARAAGFGKWTISGTTFSLYAADGTTVVHSFTLDNATTPTSRT